MTEGLVNIEAERAVLGSVLYNGAGVLSEVVGIGLSAEHFHRASHSALWKLLVWMAGKQMDIDETSVFTWLSGRPEKDFDRVGGASYLGNLTLKLPSTENTKKYAQWVIEASTRRALRDHLQQLLEDTEQGVELADLLERAQRGLLRVGARGSGDGWWDGKRLASSHKRSLEARMKAKAEGRPYGLPWGIPELDEALPQLEPGWLVLLGARPAMGKTSAALEIMRQALLRGTAAAMFSLEMTPNQLSRKLIALESDISTSKLRDGDVGDEIWGTVEDAHDVLSRWPIYVDPTPGLPLAQVLAKARRLKARLDREAGPPLGLIFVDYIQLIRAHGKSENEAIAEISRALKVLAKELEVPVVAVAQLNRDCEKLADKRPLISHLRGSGQLEQDADVIGFIYRHVVYDDDYDKHEAEFIFRKIREGTPKTVFVHWEGRTQRFGRLSVADQLAAATGSNPYS